MKRALLWSLPFLAGLLLGFGAIWPRYQEAATTAEALEIQYQELDTNYTQLESQYQELDASHAELQSQYQELETNHSELESQYQELSERHDQLERRYTRLQATHQFMTRDYERVRQELQAANQNLDEMSVELAQLRDEVSGLEQELTGLEADYRNLLQDIGESTLRDPTWEELREFLLADDTETLLYHSEKFDCSGFALTLRDRAWRRGFRCAFVEVEFEDDNAHALTAFNTTDRGLVYIDDTGDSSGTGVDKIAYVEVGKVYGHISLEAVKEEYIKPPSNPEEFWKPLVRERYQGDIFSYDYYTNWQQRVEFYYESAAAYNEAVAQCNQGGGQYSYSQLCDWYDNLDELEEELGIIFAAMGVVKNIEMYWD